MQSRCSHKPN